MIVGHVDHERQEADIAIVQPCTRSQPQRAADDLGLPLSATHRLVVSMRSRASRTSFPLNFFVREEAYILQTEVMIVRTLPVPLDPDSLRLVVRLIEACPNDLLVNAARKHFLGE